MDILLEKIEDVKREAERVQYELQFPGRQDSGTETPLSKKSKRDTNRVSASPGDLFRNVAYSAPPIPPPMVHYEHPAGDGDWVSAFRAEAGPWMGEQLVVLSLFDGIGGIWQALTNLGIPFNGYSSEVLESAVQVVKARHPRVKHVGDVRKLEKSAITEKVDLVVGGFPCQDLSIMGKKEGLHGRRSKLFFDLLRVLQIFKPKWFLVENVASMSWVDRDEITRHLKVPPMELDSQEITPSKRRRLYWTNIPHPPRLPRLREHPSTSLQSCLQNAVALEQKAGVILCSNLYKGSTVRLELVLENGTKKLRYIKQTEIELLMGYPRNYTHVLVRQVISNKPKKTEQVVESQTKVKVVEPKPSPGRATRQLRQNRVSRNFFQPQVWEKKTIHKELLKDNDRWFLLGNSFSVKVIAYLTSPLLKSAVRAQGKPVIIQGSVKEDELSAMEPGDVWALYNEHGRPNWYAVIQSRTGDRFSPIPETRKRNATKVPLRIEMQYLEMMPSYLKDEVDEWNPQRGAGLLKRRDAVDIQDSWLAFSHRVTSFVKFQDSYFVYPGKDEVWAVYNADTWSRYFVYVVGSTIMTDKLEANKPGEEGFFANCLLLQRTPEHEVYLKTSKEVDFTDLQPFCFRVPFHVRHEANSLKVEVSGVKSRKTMGYDRESTPGWRRKGKRNGSSDDDDEDLIDAEDDGPEEDGDVDDISAEEALGDDAMEVINAGAEGVEVETLPDDDSGANGDAADENEVGSGQGSGSSTLET